MSNAYDHSQATGNPHGTTKADVGLGNVDNTSDLNKPISTADALVEIFTNLTNRTATTSATIDITGNWGSSALTSADRAIATNKNWVITG